MSEELFSIKPSPETKKVFEVFADMSPRYIHAVRQTLYRMGRLFYQDAKETTKYGPRTGVLAPLYTTNNRVNKLFSKASGVGYTIPKRRRSAPGEPPQLFSGFLRKSLGFNVVGMTVLHFRDDAPYAGFLEEGTRTMAPRLFMKPAISTWSPLFPRIGAEEMAKAMGGAAA